MKKIMMENNLDQSCFSTSIEIVKYLKDLSDKDKKKKAKELENFIQKSLGVIQEDGVFAFFIYLKANDKKDIEEKMRALLKETIGKNLDENLNSIKSLGDDISELLLAKSLIEKTLIYARYQAKSMGG